MKTIVKVQIPLNSTDEKPMALVYNQDKSIQQFVEIDDHLLEQMNGKKKEFFWANVSGALITLQKKSLWQNW